MALSIKQEAFVEAYLTTFNATKAAITAGYAENSAKQQGSRLLTNADIRTRIRERLDDAAMSANEVLYHLTEIARGDFDDVIDRHGNLDMDKAREMGKTRLIRRVRERRIVTEDSDITETEIETQDRLKALELIGKYHAMFTDKIKMDDWRSQAVADIRAGKIAYEALEEAFDSDLATELFKEAGVPVSTG